LSEIPRQNAKEFAGISGGFVLSATAAKKTMNLYQE
jgi:hypothetical protein